MAYIIISEGNEKHLIQRAKERFECSQEEAKEYIADFRKVLEDQAPDDWRFTRSPVAEFLIYHEKSGFRFLGRSYRDIGKEFLEELEKAKVENFSSLSDEPVIKELAEEYLQILQEPDSIIVHEIKTVYNQRQHLGKLKQSYQLARINLSHLIPINTRIIATRPNAIVTEDNTLWVRQDELIELPHEIDYLFFERLTKKGIDKSKVRIYTHHQDGNIKFYQEYSRNNKEIFLSKPRLSSSFHTASYWSLPTYVDNTYLDLKYKSEHFPFRLTEREAFLKFRIEVVINYLKIKLKWKPPGFSFPPIISL